jgi:hypothetical protein
MPSSIGSANQRLRSSTRLNFGQLLSALPSVPRTGESFSRPEAVAPTEETDGQCGCSALGMLLRWRSERAAISRQLKI